LFVVAFVELFVVGRRVSGLADDKAVSSCLDDFDGGNRLMPGKQVGKIACTYVVFPLPVESGPGAALLFVAFAHYVAHFCANYLAHRL
jgi:hypothetical protein